MTTEATTVLQSLVKVQQEIKVPKNKTNKFGGYNYRNAEDILDAAKKLAAPLGCAVTLNDEIELIGQRFYVKAAATFTSSDGGSVTTTAYAREEDAKKGMDGSQITGAASSYARKYALNGLFAIDDGIDSDSTNDGSDAPKTNSKPPASKPKSEQPKVQQSEEIVTAGKRLKELCEAYGKTDAAKSAPAKALLFDTLKKNGMAELKDLGKCTNVMVFTELIDVLELALGSGGVSA